MAGGLSPFCFVAKIAAFKGGKWIALHTVSDSSEWNYSDKLSAWKY